MPVEFDTDYIDALNRRSSKGKLLKMVEFVETVSPPVTKYWVDHEDEVIFEGHTWVPLKMYFNQIKVSAAMPTETCEIALSNLGNIVVKYLKEVDPTGNAVTLKLTHLDLLSTLTKYQQFRMRVLRVSADVNAVVFMLGRNLGKGRLPRGVLTSDEAPGLSSDTPRF